MNKGKAEINDPTLLVDINEATLAVKEQRFADALKILEINHKEFRDLVGKNINHIHFLLIS